MERLRAVAADDDRDAREAARRLQQRRVLAVLGAALALGLVIGLVPTHFRDEEDARLVTSSLVAAAIALGLAASVVVGWLEERHPRLLSRLLERLRSIIEFPLFEVERASRASLTAEGKVRSGAQLAWVDLRRASLADAQLAEADLRGADLREADLRTAVLRGADLRNADLRGADLSAADLTGADSSGARIDRRTLLPAQASPSEPPEGPIRGGAPR